MDRARIYDSLSQSYAQHGIHSPAWSSVPSPDMRREQARDKMVEELVGSIRQEARPALPLDTYPRVAREYVRTGDILSHPYLPLALSPGRVKRCNIAILLFGAIIIFLTCYLISQVMNHTNKKVD